MPAFGRTFDVYVRGEPAAVEAALGQLGGRQADGSYALACGTARVGPKAALVAIDLAANVVSTMELLEKLASLAASGQLSLEANGATVQTGAALIECWKLDRIAADRNVLPSVERVRWSERNSPYLIGLLLAVLLMMLAFGGCIEWFTHIDWHT